jgi:cytochrome b561
MLCNLHPAIQARDFEMGVKSDGRRYGAVAITIHWATAVAVFALLGSGLVMDDMADNATKISILTFHAAAGFFTGVLTLLRILWWAFADDWPSHTAQTPRWQARAAGAVHGLLYAIILLMVSSGMAMMLLSGAPEVLMNGGTLPQFEQFAPRIPHGLGAWTLMALIAAHVGAALYHQFALRDRLLGRMASARRETRRRAGGCPSASVVGLAQGG